MNFNINNIPGTNAQKAGAAAGVAVLLTTVGGYFAKRSLDKKQAALRDRMHALTRTAKNLAARVNVFTTSHPAEALAASILIEQSLSIMNSIVDNDKLVQKAMFNTEGLDKINAMLEEAAKAVVALEMKK